MIRVEADLSEDWDSSTDWRRLAEQAALSAVAASKHIALIGAGLGIEVSVKFTGDAEVQALNAAYRDKDRPTNVLAFPMFDAALLEALGSTDGGEVLLGDVVLARGVCTREAQTRGVSVEEHAMHLIVHGTLHLLGYDHERGEGEAEAMEQIERDALASLGVADPYRATEVQS
jgi:probable rRNA maturation factor